MKYSSFDQGPFKTNHSFRGGVRKEVSFHDEWNLEYETPYWVRVIENDLCLDLYIHLKDTKKIIFSGQDALIDGRKELPYFYRTRWAAALPCSFITFNDPSLYHSDFFGAGYFCLPNSWKIMKRAVDKVISSLSYAESDVFFYGASAGGYWALSMAGHYPQSTFIVDIPQVDLDAYFREPIKEQFREVFKIDKNLPCAFDFWHPESNFPKYIFYLQNYRDSFHIRTQQSYFLRRASETTERNPNGINNISLLFYDTPPDTRGHSPLSQEKTLNLLTSLVEGSWPSIT